MQRLDWAVLGHQGRQSSKAHAQTRAIQRSHLRRALCRAGHGLILARAVHGLTMYRIQGLQALAASFSSSMSVHAGAAEERLACGGARHHRQHRVGHAPGCWQGSSGAVEDSVGGHDIL